MLRSFATILGFLVCATSYGTTQQCPKDSPISHEVYQHQNTYTAIIIVDGGNGYIDSLEEPHMGIGFYNDSPAVDVLCKDYGDASKSMPHILACIYPNNITSLLTVVGFTSIIKNNDPCYTQKFTILTKAIPFPDQMTITQCTNKLIADPATCTTLVQNAILEKLPESKNPPKDPYSPPPSQPQSQASTGTPSTEEASKCPPPGYINTAGNCVTAAESKKELCASGNYILLGGKGCGTDCGANQVAKMGMCVCQTNFIPDPANPQNCIANPALNQNLPVSAPSSGGGSCSLIRDKQ